VGHRILRAGRGWAAASFCRACKRGKLLPPILLARAGKDSPGLNATIDRFAAEAVSRDVAIELHNIQGVPHAFDIRTPSPEVRRVIARVIAFMKASLEQ
jgi:dienelactone hydrolase